MNLGMSDRVRPLVAAVRDFIDERIIPAELTFRAEINGGKRFDLSEKQRQILDDLKSAARKQGLWNFWLTEPEAGGGAGLSTVEYAWLAEEMGRSQLAAEVFNCNAPDTGNMEVLLRYGSDQQKARWLQPLLEGQIRSAFAMTEPGVASSDASNISTTGIERDGSWVINGEKTYITGAGDPRCAVMIVMALTDPDGPKRQRHSQILVPTDTPGVEIVRPMEVFGTDDAPSGHMHLRFSDATVPLDHVIAGRGRGFEISQGRLGPGRVHHCMRAIGLAEKALDLMCRRGLERTAFRKPIAWLGGNPERIARARIDIDMARLLTLRTAWEIDNNGLDVARVWISKIKATVPAVVTRVIDDAIQLHGAAGLSQDTELATMYMAARALRIVDGPDEVHAMVVARDTLNPYR